MTEEELFRVEKKMAYGGKGKAKDRSVLVYNSHVTLRGIPAEVDEYQLGLRSALDWIIDRYWIRTDKNSHIVNDPNTYSDDPRYIIDLIKRVVTVSVETVKIVKGLPSLGLSD
ncbi:type ISP restriction/modification enzyme [Tessaracoccus lacteus]|uniref:Type ISP restriction-modification enzyme LLaBIII C-terminal specificity domain-containing protein n=1 Tax=Tessaracoccus lacteus TaxID=3041766 RepID=A0ABY8PXM4_9ACTN|nr:type ISP restriction/modification enzyme [Tessaracoccus sp. T21]WGT47157.1 hypothetical protein QH948_13745 [Tessaracoccus sp. T21]